MLPVFLTKNLKPLYLFGKGKSFFHLPWISLDSLWVHRTLSHTALHSPTGAEEKTCNTRRALRFGQISYWMTEKPKTICPVHEAMDQSRQREAEGQQMSQHRRLHQYLHHTCHSPSPASALSWGTLCCDAETCFWGQTEERQNCLMGLQIFKTINCFVINDDAPDFLCLEGAKGDLTVNCSSHLGECCF